MKKKRSGGRFIQYRKDIDKVRIVHNKTLFIIIIVMLVVLAGLLYYANYLDLKASSGQKCVLDSDCVKVQIGCCPCSSGGEEKCVLKSLKGDYLEKLGECSEDIVCSQVFNCNMNECSCINGECVTE